MSDTTQLKALRDAMTERNPVTGAQPLCMVSRADIDHAIASLEAAEPVAEEDGWSVARCVRCGQTWTFNVTPPICSVRGPSMRCTPIPRAHEQPKPCASFYGAYENVPGLEIANRAVCCRTCGQPYDAHQQPPAEQAQQPAYAPALTPFSQPIPVRTHCTCAFDDVPGEYPCAVHGEEPTIPLAQHEAIVAAVQGQVAQARREAEAGWCAAWGHLWLEQWKEAARIDVARWVHGTHTPLGKAFAQERAQARREGLREALALVERDRKRVAVEVGPHAAWNALNEAADGIRALAEKGGEVGKP